MSNLTPEQIRQLRENRFKNMGLPSGVGTIVDSNPVVSNGSKSKIFQKLQDIKRGAKKNQYKQFVQTMDKSSASGYQIPESSQKPKQIVKERSKNAIEPQVFNAPRNAEAESLERMFTDGISSRGAVFKNTSEEFVSEGYGPVFDPVSQISSKANNAMQTPQLQQNNIDFESLKEMMFKIAQEVSKETMKSVISEFIEKNKKRNTYEVYNKDKNVIKINEKLYKLTPVKIKGH